MGLVQKMFGRPNTSEQSPSYRSARWFVQLTVGMAVFTDIFLYALIVPVMPFSLKSRVHLVDNEIQSWVSILIAVYGGALAILSPICGWFADRSSNRKFPLAFGLISLAGATILLHIGPNITILVLGRILQGISAAVSWVVGLAILVDTVPQAEIGRSMGLVFFAMSMGVLVGPLFGGFVFEKAGYNAVFIMAYGLILVDLLLCFLIKIVPKKVINRSDSDQEVLDTRAGSPIEESSQIDPEKDQTAASINSINSEGDRDTTAFGKPPISPKRQVPAIITLLRSRRLLCCLWGVMISAILMSQFDSVLPIHVKDTFQWDSTAAGLIFLPITLTAFLSPVVGWGVDKYGPRWFAVAGFLSLAPFEILLMLVSRNVLSQKILLCFLLAMIGISFDLAIPPLLVEVTAVIEEKENKQPGIFGEKGAMAQAYGLFNLAWALGALIGPIWAGLVNEHLGWKTMAWSLALLSFVTAFPLAVWTGGSIFNPEKRRRSKKPARQDIYDLH